MLQTKKRNEIPERIERPTNGFGIRYSTTELRNHTICLVACFLVEDKTASNISYKNVHILQKQKHIIFHNFIQILVEYGCGSSPKFCIFSDLIVVCVDHSCEGVVFRFRDTIVLIWNVLSQIFVLVLKCHFLE